MAVVGLWHDGLSAQADLMRMATVGMPTSGLSPLTVSGGIRWTPGDPGLVVAAGGLAVTVNPFIGVIPASSSGLGGYGVANTAVLEVPLTAADPALQRKDLLVAKFDAVGPDFEIVPVDGIPGDPDLPALPPDALLLADVTVPAGALTGAELVIVDRRTFLAAADAPSAAVAVTGEEVGDTIIAADPWSSMDTPMSREFIAPPSGRVQITVAAVGWASAAGVVEFGVRIIGPAGFVRDPGTSETGQLLSTDLAVPGVAVNTFLLTALTPGELYTALFVAQNGGGAEVGHFFNRRIVAVPAL